MAMPRISSLCVYCGSGFGTDPEHRAATVVLGRALAAAGVTLVYGGGKVGLMGVLADACLSAGGRVVGIIPAFLYNREVGHGGASELIIVDSMHQRKQTMFERSDAFCILPGGLGTLDETFEIMTWRQLRLHDKPIILVDHRGYWRPFLDLIEATVAGGFAPASARALVTVVNRPEEVLPAAFAAAPEKVPDQPERL
jgi:uncharacterized protein (TIGR00730 family)